MTFQSTPPVWGATEGRKTVTRRVVFQSTPPVWGATELLIILLIRLLISIHAPRVGGDSKNS